MNEEKVLAKSEFNPSGIHKIAFVFYILFFLYGFLLGYSFDLNARIGLLTGLLSSLAIGGLIHFALYFPAKNNKLTLTNYKITGTYRRQLSLNIPIDSVTSVAKGSMGSLHITCAGDNFSISWLNNREVFCSKLNELLNTRAHQSLKGTPPISYQQSNYDEIAKLKQLLDNGIITQEEFDAKKKQILGL